MHNAEQQLDLIAETNEAVTGVHALPGRKVPMYLSGAIRFELECNPEAFGLMRTPNMGNKQLPALRWAADNGCYSASGERDFDLARYTTWLAAQDASTCLFATAPDKVGDAAETLRRSIPVLPTIRALGYKAALVAQNGMVPSDVPWNEIDCLFIGGDTAWKLGAEARELVYEAKRRGKWVHMGRVNSLKRYRYAMQIGCDSVDGTYLAFGPSKNLPKLLSWVTKLLKEVCS